MYLKNKCTKARMSPNRFWNFCAKTHISRPDLVCFVGEYVILRVAKSFMEASFFQDAHLLLKNRYFYYATFFSLLNLLCGITLCFYGHHNMIGVITLLSLAVFSDGMDGLIARQYKVQTQFGKLLDSVADSVSFGFFPGIYMLEYIKNYGLENSYVMCIPMLYITFALYREMRISKRNNEYLGIPNTLCAFLVISYMLHLEKIEFSLLILPIAAMLANFRLPTLESLIKMMKKEINPFYFTSVIVTLFFVATYVFIHQIIIALNILIGSYLLMRCVCWIVGLLIELIASSYRLSQENMPGILTKGIYTYYVKDILNLLLSINLMPYQRNDILIIVGDKFGGIFLSNILKFQGFTVLRVSNTKKITWRLAYKKTLEFKYVFISADGPFGPYGLLKKGCRRISRFTQLPLYLIKVNAGEVLTLKKFRGGFNIPLPFSMLKLDIELLN